ncbi:hypothetical protein WG66_013572 [Moniliophthora roreri]|uniref:Uncharacterized protein n=1 Tax=Moniliophthora roreri TaxID=221103 RepID=A0A0W0FSM0_MONRR|nr:hypothetical protein WG66_013572 [Moniliophthora roreri]
MSPFPLLFLVVIPALCKATQIPFSSTTISRFYFGGYGDLESERWDLDVEPSMNATENLIFETISSLLQQWPNTRYRNGHTIVPAHILPGTLLYHGRSDPNLPTGPEWTATDPEHSTVFCRTTDDKGCWHITLVATRLLNVLYFDGSSAAKMPYGSMDTQDIIAWGLVNSTRYFAEQERLAALCTWGKPLGIDGFVRMEMDFEVMLCDFTAGLEVESMLNLEIVDSDPSPPIKHRINQDLARLYYDINSFGARVIRRDIEVIRAGGHHNTFPGETRIQLDLSRLISFYDTELVPSLVEPRLKTKSRLAHRLERISSEDIKAVMHRLEDTYSSPAATSGIDWFTLLRVIKDRYADRLELIRDILNETTTSRFTDDLRARNIHVQLTVMMQPYLLYSMNSTSHSPSPFNSSTSWAKPAFELCSTAHTRYISSSLVLSSALTPSEILILRAVEGTTKEICRTVTNMWVRGVEAGLHQDEKSDEDEPPRPQVSTARLFDSWRVEVERLMSWLDWSIWLKCRPRCAIGEICYLPTWPFFRWSTGSPPGFPGRGHRGPPPHGFAFGGKEQEDADWFDPQPTCHRIIQPLDY